MGDEILFGNTPIFDKLVREMRDRGTPFEGMIADGEKTLRKEQEDVVTWEVSPLATKALTGLIRARDICQESLGYSDLPVVLNEDIERAEEFKMEQEAGSPVSRTHLTDWTMVESYYGEPKDLVVFAVQKMYNELIAQFPYVVFNRIHISKIEIPGEGNGPAFVLRTNVSGFTFERGLPERFEKWTLGKMLKPLVVSVDENGSLTFLPDVREEKSEVEEPVEEADSGSNEPDKFTIKQSLSVDDVMEKSVIFNKLSETFRIYQRDNPGAIAEEISTEHVYELGYPGSVTFTIRGTNYVNGIPSEYEEWYFERMIADMLFDTPQVPRRLNFDNEIKRTSHITELAKVAEQYLGADGAVKAVREASIPMTLEKPIHGFEGVRPAVSTVDEFQFLYFNEEEKNEVKSRMRELQDNLVAELKKQYPDLVAVRNLDLVPQVDGSMMIEAEGLRSSESTVEKYRQMLLDGSISVNTYRRNLGITREAPDEVSVIGEDLPDSLYMKGLTWGSEDEEMS